VTKPEFARAATPKFKTRYDNFIGGRWVAPVNGRYFENTSPVNGRVLCEVARSDAADVELALDAAHAAKDAWGKTSVAERAVILNKIADRIEANLQAVAEAETWDNGKPVRETLAADIPLAIDHFRYFAGCIRAQEGGISELDHDTVAYHFHEPLGVVGQIIPWNFPILMGKSPNIFFKDVMDADDAFLDKALEGFAMFALNQGEVCTCPSRALIHEDIYEAFIEKAIARVEAIVQGSSVPSWP